MSPSPALAASCRGWIDTDLGRIAFLLYPDRAPASVAAFRHLVSGKSFELEGCFYRVVRRCNALPFEAPIDIVQAGLLNPRDVQSDPAHEPTGQTGLRHRHGALSWARGPMGKGAGRAFFFCIGDQPALDEGGARDPFADGLGFATFGFATGGFEVLEAIHAGPTAMANGDRLAEPVPIRSVGWGGDSGPSECR